MQLTKGRWAVSRTNEIFRGKPDESSLSSPPKKKTHWSSRHDACRDSSLFGGSRHHTLPHNFHSANIANRHEHSSLPHRVPQRIAITKATNQAEATLHLSINSYGRHVLAGARGNRPGTLKPSQLEAIETYTNIAKA